MKPYYQDNFVTLYNCANEDMISELEPAGLLLTDPPYGINIGGQKTIGGNKLTRCKEYGKHSWDLNTPPPEILNKFIALANHSIIFGGNYFQLPPSSCWIVWDKDNSAGFADAELAWTNFKSAVRIFRYRWNGMLQGNMKDKEQRWHPTQKPLPLMKWCIENYSKPADIILDPYAGSGTTGRAAKDLGRMCVLIEREEKYCEVAAKRLSQETLFDMMLP